MNDTKIIKALKGGSFSSTAVVCMPNEELRVRKEISRTRDREYGLVRWQSQIRRLQQLNKIIPEHCPRILELGVLSDRFYYDIPYYPNSLDVFGYLSKVGAEESANVFGKVTDLIDQYSGITYGTVKGSLSVFIAEEICQRLVHARQCVTDDSSLGFLSTYERLYVLNRIASISKTVNWAVSKSRSMVMNESLTHGNLTLENMLYVESEQKVVLIDPYSETYCESVLGDYSQLMQSSVSFYEAIVLLGEAGVEDVLTSDPTIINEGVAFFGDLLTDKLSKLSPEGSFVLNVFHAAQFIRMFPFKVANQPKLAIYFLLHGLKILEESRINA